jgi:hypothetical protein
MAQSGGVFLQVVKPNPVPLDGILRSERQIIQHRKLDCPFYAGCLDYSVNAGWESFSCLQCPIAARLEEAPKDIVTFANQRKGDRFTG